MKGEQPAGLLLISYHDNSGNKFRDLAFELYDEDEEGPALRTEEELVKVWVRGLD